MTNPPDFDLERAHRHFSAICFNQVWELLDLPERTVEQQRQMVDLSLASVYHWRQRSDCADLNLSVGYWLVSRVHATLGRAYEALHYAGVCESYSGEAPPFYRGYAFEARARALAMLGQLEAAAQARGVGQALLEQITDEQERLLLATDLEMIHMTPQQS